MAKHALEFAADGIQSYEDCQKVALTDVETWVQANASKHTQVCLSDSIAVYMDIKKAIADQKAGASHTDIMADWFKTMQDMNTLAQTCMWD